MFEYATEKLQDARASLKRLRTMSIPPRDSNIKFVSGPEGIHGEKVSIVNPKEFKEAFSSCIYHLRAVHEAIFVDYLEKLGTKLKEKELKEKNQYDDFINWRKERSKVYQSLDNGELIEYIHKQRITDFHAGVSTLSFTMNGHSFSTTDLGKKPSPDAEWVVNGKGVFWVENIGTPKVDDIPSEVGEGCSFDVVIVNPPTLHLNKPISSNDPISICEIALNYYEELLFEAKNKFGD